MQIQLGRRWDSGRTYHVHDCAPDSRLYYVVTLFLHFLPTMDGLKKLFSSHNNHRKPLALPSPLPRKSKPCLERTSHFAVKSMSSEATFNFQKPSPGSRAPHSPTSTDYKESYMPPPAETQLLNSHLFARLPPRALDI